MLSRDTGQPRLHSNPYGDYDQLGSDPFLLDGVPDPRLPAMEPVMALGGAQDPLAVPLPALTEVCVVDVEVSGTVRRTVFLA